MMSSNGSCEVVSFLVPEDQSSTSGHPVRCKFVLLQDRASLVMIFGPLTRYAYHADLLAAYCDSRQITAVWERRPDTLRIKSPDITILGGGHLAWNLLTGEVRFGGSSKAYGPIDLQGLPELLQATQTFAHHKIIVDD